jgi:nucleoside-triphosphatase
MTIAPLKILLTGHPGSGKTSTIRSVVDRLRGRVPMTGFLTEEIREAGRRVGFRGVTLDGRDFLLAHSRNSGTARVGPYGVDLTGLESIGLEALTPATPDTLVVVDEIGKMECLSEAFRTRVAQLLNDDTPLIASVAVIGVGFVKRVRHNPRAKLYTMTRGESERMAAEIVRFVERSVLRDEGGES